MHFLDEKNSSCRSATSALPSLPAPLSAAIFALALIRSARSVRTGCAQIEFAWRSLSRHQSLSAPGFRLKLCKSLNFFLIRRSWNRSLKLHLIHLVHRLQGVRACLEIIREQFLALEEQLLLSLPLLSQPLEKSHRLLAQRSRIVRLSVRYPHNDLAWKRSITPEPLLPTKHCQTPTSDYAMAAALVCLEDACEYAGNYTHRMSLTYDHNL